jgi:hypothetical protein
MRHYLLKTYDPAGRLIGRADYRAASDEEAADAIQTLAQNRWRELWCGPRLVGAWDGDQPIKPARQPAPRSRQAVLAALFSAG